MSAIGTNQTNRTNNAAADLSPDWGSPVQAGKASPAIATQASPGNLLGAPVSDTAQVFGGNAPTGTVTFRLFSDATCTAEVFSSTAPLSGGTATSGQFTPTAPGTYHWTAAYSGDEDNNGAASPCNDANESVTIQPFQPAPCTRTLTGDVTGPIAVNPGETLCIVSARVVGPVNVPAGGALVVTNSQILNGIVANNPAFFTVCGSMISAPRGVPTQGIVVTNANVPLRIGDPATGCAPNRVSGDVTLSGNRAGVTFGGNLVSRNVTINDNGPGNTVVKSNTISLTLACSGNEPAPTNAGQPNTAGAKTGQCSTL
jgi:Bacterial Ig-like domain (group 3)